MKKLGLFFGSFNPIHYIHFSMAKKSISFLDLEHFFFIPTPQNPFKKNETLIDFSIRLETLKQVVKEENIPNVSVCEIEANMKQPNYTYKTLEKIKILYPQSVLYFILGEDNLALFPKWKHYEKILSTVKLAVFSRKNSTTKLNKIKIPHIIIPSPYENLSGTEIREKITNEKDISKEMPWKEARKYFEKEFKNRK